MSQIVDGDYYVTFRSTLGVFGGGRVTISGDRISGGDIGYHYDGELLENGDQVKGRVVARRYDKDMASVFGDIEELELELEGTFENGEGVFNGGLKGVPGLQILVRLKPDDGSEPVID